MINRRNERSSPMFDFLKGGKANVTVTLDRPVQPYLVGETVQARINIQGQKDLKIQEARVQLVCHEEYQYKSESRSTDSDGHVDTSEQTRWATDEQVVQRQQLMPEGTIPANFNQTFEFAAPITAGLPPTLDGGRIVRAKWMVKVTLDRKLAGDTEVTADLLVFSAPTGQAGGAGQYGFSNAPSDAEMVLSLPGKECGLGETIQGELIVRPQKAFDVSEIRVEITREELVPRDRGNKYRESKAVKVAGKTRLEPGQTLTLPFAIQVPTAVPVTMRSRNSSVTWSLSGILARTLRADTRVEEEIFVFSGRPQR
jgi:sporulation-control protein spo0M